jgi:RNA polymerase sigma factor for flagellar operon FliA
MMNIDTKTVNIPKDDIDKLWKVFKETGNLQAKNELLLHYIHLVKWTVRRMMPKYNSYNEYDDLVNCGVIGLIDAVEKFNLDHGVKFETYAGARIYGEILDYMRSQDWAPPSLRKKINAVMKTYEALEAQQQSPPTEDNVADALNMPVTQVRKILSQTHMFNLVNFEDTLSSSSAINEVSAPEDQNPESTMLNKEMKKLLAEMIDTLPEKERLVITLYYYEGLLLKDIAEILDVSESRVSQIHSKVLIKMRSKLQKIL